MISAYLAVAGLTDVGYTFFDASESPTGARETASVVDAGGGWYSANVNPPAGTASVRWDSDGTPAAIAREYFAPDSGVGAHVVTITVTASAVPLQNATVTLGDGVSYFSADTNVSGVATFALEAGTYSCAIVKGGYAFSSDTITVTTAANFAKSMTAIVTASPSAPNLCVVHGVFTDIAAAAATVTILFKLRAPKNATAGGVIVSVTEYTATTDETGSLSIELIRTDDFDQPNAYYELNCVALGWSKRRLVLATGSFDLATIR